MKNLLILNNYKGREIALNQGEFMIYGLQKGRDDWITEQMSAIEAKSPKIIAVIYLDMFLCAARKSTQSALWTTLTCGR